MFHVCVVAFSSDLPVGERAGFSGPYDNRLRPGSLAVWTALLVIAEDMDRTYRMTRSCAVIFLCRDKCARTIFRQLTTSKPSANGHFVCPFAADFLLLRGILQCCLGCCQARYWYSGW